MRLAWLHPQLAECCTRRVALHAAAGAQAEAAEDLIHLVAQAPRLRDLAGFHSVRTDVVAVGDLTISIKEVDMYAQPLNDAGLPEALVGPASLADHALSQALLVRDFRVQGQSILRMAS